MGLPSQVGLTLHWKAGYMHLPYLASAALPPGGGPKGRLPWDVDGEVKELWLQGPMT